MFEPEIETRGLDDQRRLDDASYRRQVAYLLANSDFYRAKLADAGFTDAARVGGLDNLAALPMTEKDELRASRDEAHPIGTHLAAPMSAVVRVFSTSGTTGTPSYIPLTAHDLETWVRTSARSYSAAGLGRNDRLVSTYNAGPFVAGVTLDAFNRIGLCHIPVGSGNTDRLMSAIRFLKPTALAMTPSYALHLAEWAAERGIDPAGTSVARILVAGEPGGGEPAMRARLEGLWDADVTEAMGIGDISVSLWGECEEKQGMHFSGRGFVHAELIDPGSGAAIPFTDGATGELVYTHLDRQAAPLLRFRSRDHVEVWTGKCACGRTSHRVRCIGRTDDMLVVRGVNVFPTALREIVNQFAPAVSGVLKVRPRQKGFRQDPPLPVAVELSEDAGDPGELADRIRKRIREALLVTTEIELLPYGELPRSDYKSALVDWSAATG
ncbi:MAG TPA: phenylacetate--CoA ligase family protein [Bauldia sp.]|nr:phenylacetate--CoA ligase family protein [Bauldia sp.]